MNKLNKWAADKCGIRIGLCVIAEVYFWTTDIEPVELVNGEWTENRVHNWRNYVSDGLKNEWVNLNGRQKIILSANFDDIAGREEWD